MEERKDKYFSDNVKQLVKNLLSLHEGLRDDDGWLWGKVTKALCPYDLKKITGHQLVIWIIKEGLKDGAVSRVRRKVQELHPETRGHNWGKRHLEMQEQVKEEIQDDFDF